MNSARELAAIPAASGGAATTRRQWLRGSILTQPNGCVSRRRDGSTGCDITHGLWNHADLVFWVFWVSWTFGSWLVLGAFLALVGLFSLMSWTGSRVWSVCRPPGLRLTG